MQTPLRAARMDGCSTLWMRTMDRLLGPATARAQRRPTAPAVACLADAAPPTPEAGPAEDMPALSDDAMPRCPPLPAAPHWIAPARLPELLIGMRRDVSRRPLHHALAG